MRELGPHKTPVALFLALFPAVARQLRAPALLAAGRRRRGRRERLRPRRQSAAAAASASAAAVARRRRTAAEAAKLAARSAATARARELVDDVRWMVAKGVTMNRDKAGEGDVTTKCDALEATRSGLGDAPDPELVAVLDEGAALCAFDVPLLTASESLDHFRGNPTQASRLLMCNVAEREIAKARAIRPGDPRVLRADARRLGACR
ncbi:MAG: hypothetical protein KF850_13580 [Labilithrix sp.]|nr:hypothetical protein [Labilithrix sp.]